MIVCVIFTFFNIFVPLFISCKPYVMFVDPTCWMWSSNLLYLDLIEENELGGFERKNLFFVIPVSYMPYFLLLPFVIIKQYGEGEISRCVVFVYVLVFNFILTIFPLGVCSAWSTIASLVNTLPLWTYPHSSYLFLISDFLLF